MSTFTLVDASMWLHDTAVHDLANQVQVDLSRETQDNTRFKQSARTMAPGLFVNQISASGFTDLTGYDADLYETYDGATLAAVTVSATGGDGDVAYSFKGLHTQLQPFGGSVGDMSGVSLQAEGTGGDPPVHGTILHPQAAETVTGVGVGRQLGAVSATRRVYGAIHVIAASGTSPTLNADIRSDDANTFLSPTARLTFSTATGKTSQFISAAGPITDDWWRVQFTIGGTTPSFTFVVAVGIL